MKKKKMIEKCYKKFTIPLESNQSQKSRWKLTKHNNIGPQVTWLIHGHNENTTAAATARDTHIPFLSFKLIAAESLAEAGPSADFFAEEALAFAGAGAGGGGLGIKKSLGRRTLST